MPLPGSDTARLERRPGEVLAPLLTLLVMIAFGCLVFAHPNPPAFGDYAEWTYHGVLLRDVMQGHPDPGYWLKTYPVPNSASTVGLGLLMLAMPWQVASKLWLLLVAIFGAVSVYRLQRIGGAAHLGQMLLLLPAMVLSGVLWYGFLNFLLGCYVVLTVAAVLLQGTARPWLISLLLVLNFFCHMIPFGFACVLAALYAVQHRRLRLLWTLLPGALLCVWYFAGRLAQHNADGQAGMISSAPYGSAQFVLYKANSLLKCWGFVNPVGNDGHSVLLGRLGSAGFLAVFACSLSAALLGCWMLALCARRALLGRAENRFVWGAAALFLTVGLLLPGAAAGISDPGGRMIELAVWCGLCVAGSQASWVRWCFTGCGVLLLGADLLLLTSAAGNPMSNQAAQSRLPGALQNFNHVYAFDDLNVYQTIRDGQMHRWIYPTAMFLKR